MSKAFLISVAVIFVVLSVVFILMNRYDPAFGMAALEGGNVVMALLAVVTFVIVQRQTGSRPQAFVRGVYGATFLKLIVCMVSIMVYVLLNKEHIHKPTVIALFGIYVVYTVAETRLLSKIVRQ